MPEERDKGEGKELSAEEVIAVPVIYCSKCQVPTEIGGTELRSVKGRTSIFSTKITNKLHLI